MIHWTETYTSIHSIAEGMAPTVDDFRNEIRLAVDRFERPDSTAFTKESLAAICEAVGYEINQNRFPSKAQMRAGILWKVGVLDEDNPDDANRPFRKTELETITKTLTENT